MADVEQETMIDEELELDMENEKQIESNVNKVQTLAELPSMIRSDDNHAGDNSKNDEFFNEEQMFVVETKIVEQPRVDAVMRGLCLYTNTNSSIIWVGEFDMREHIIAGQSNLKSK